MTAQPLHNITSERAIDLLKDGQALTNCYVDGQIKIETNETWSGEVVFENCIIEYFSGSATQFERPVRFINTHFKKCQFVFTYFPGGLIIENCAFDSYLDFQAGGHNRNGNEVKITNNDFGDFVNFFDCWYQDKVNISDNKFRKGTNLLGRPNNIPVTFDIEPTISNNVGTLDLDHEGENQSN
jgi:hypothetical protein